MNHLQYYLTKLAEECSEVAQIALKTQQFGPDEVMPGQPFSNFERIHFELDDLWAMIEVLNDRFNFDYIPNPGQIDLKKKKVLKYLDFSMGRGMVEGSGVTCAHPMSL